ncbi:hypothetical protein [Anaerosporobacter sp.]|uniref:hypothetical protein n=1 Tax=Anaerosporobacter sp. TaxID=1872529 RepID=UPI00286F2219|nr:hypothetical protein [Anaerosporobacter sp.]
MKNKKKCLFVVVTMVITASVLLLVNYLAVTFCIENLKLFTALVLVVPMVCIAIVAFIIGYHMRWNWKRSIGIALVLTLISYGAGQLPILIAGDSMESVVVDEEKASLSSSADEELMNELYDELDKKAYEYMLEQGLISDGEEIYGGEDSINGNASDETAKKGEETDNEVLHSELYVGIQKADSTTELIGNVLTFFVALGLSVVGRKVRCSFDAKR